MQLAHAAGVPVVLDAGGASDPLTPELLRCLAVISPNETELQGLTGEKLCKLSCCVHCCAMSLTQQEPFLKTQAHACLPSPASPTIPAHS